MRQICFEVKVNTCLNLLNSSLLSLQRETCNEIRVVESSVIKVSKCMLYAVNYPQS